MPANVDAMVREGVNAFKTGKKDEARTLFMKAVELDQYNEQAWLWLSAVVDGAEDQRTCLENVLAINPSNERARKGLDLLTNAEEPPPPPTPAATSQNIEWETPDWNSSGIATSSASAYMAVDEPSDQDYDSWLDNLNIGSAAEQQPEPANVPFTTGPFEDPNLFGYDDDDVMTNGPFSSAAFDIDEIDTPAPAPSRAAAPPAPAPEPPAKKMSPSREQPAYTDDMRGGDVFSDMGDDDDFSDEDLGDLDAEELFSYIPSEIKATRLPGTREGQPALLTIAMLLLIVLNIGAAALLVYRMV